MLCADVACIHAELDAKLRAFVRRRVDDPPAAEDILQDVYVRIHAHAATLRDDLRIRGWVYQIARNAIVDYYRARREHAELPETFATESEECDAACDLAADLPALVDALPEKYRQALVLTEYQGLTQVELARQLGISLSGAKSRVQRAREQLREMLLQCCHFEFDREGRLVHYEERCCCCDGAA